MTPSRAGERSRSPDLPYARDMPPLAAKLPASVLPPGPVPVATTWLPPGSPSQTLRPATTGGLRLLLLGDPHGHWRLAAALLRAYADIAGGWADGIIALGDLSYYPEPTRLDRATRKHGARDPEQMTGFDRLLGGRDPQMRQWLAGAPPIDCIGGNHEDHQALADLMRRNPHLLRVPLPGHPTTPVRLLRSGRVHGYASADGTTIAVGALWGIAPGDDRRKPPVVGRHIDPDDVAKLREASFDFLATHDAPRATNLAHRESAAGVGAYAITELLQRRPLALQAGGHYHHREGRRIGPQGHQLGILRVGVPTAAAVLQGIPGAWEIVPMGAVPAWWERSQELVSTLPPSARLESSPPGDETTPHSEA